MDLVWPLVANYPSVACITTFSANSSFIVCAVIDMLENLANRPPSSVVVMTHAIIGFSFKAFVLSVDVIFFRTQPYTTSCPRITMSTHFNPANHIYITTGQSVLSRAQVQMHAYGLYYLSPYRTHSSISSHEVGNNVF
jgi:hypothetical protein